MSFASLPKRLQWLHLRQNEKPRPGTESPPRLLTEEERRAKGLAFVQLTGKARRKTERCLEAIQTYEHVVAAEPDRAKADLQAWVAREFGISPRTLRRLILKANSMKGDDRLVALAPMHKGAKPRAGFLGEPAVCLEECWLCESQPTYMAAYKDWLGHAADHGWPPVSYSTARRHLRSIPETRKRYRREGPASVNDMIPPLVRDYGSLALHELWEADGHKADIWCLWPDGEVMRPIILVWRDVRSRYPLGWAIGKTESSELVRLSFRNAAMRMMALPRHALLDNGRGFASKQITGGQPTRYRFVVNEKEVKGILTKLEVKVHWAMPHHGQSKPIESWFRIIASDLCRRPEFELAYCGNKPGAKPECSSPANAIPIDVFEKKLAEHLDAYCRNHEHRGDTMDGRTPESVYNELASSSASVRCPTQELLDVMLLRTERVWPDQRNGAVMTALKNRYWSPRLAELPRGLHYIVRYDPTDAREAVRVYDEQDRFLTTAEHDGGKAGFLDEESAKKQARARAKLRNATRERDDAQRELADEHDWSRKLRPHKPAVRAGVASPKVVEPVRAATAQNRPSRADEYLRKLGREHIAAQSARPAARPRSEAAESVYRQFGMGGNTAANS